MKPISLINKSLLVTFRRIVFIGIIMVVSCGKKYQSSPDTTQYQFKETRDLVGLVNEAAQLFSQKGSDAFTEFSKKDSKWFSGTKYIFIYNLAGENVFHPVLKDLPGKNVMNLTDINGKPIIRNIVSIASDTRKPYGWIHYLWAEPGEIFPTWKNAYIMGVRGPDGKTYAIGSGTYNYRTELQFVVEIVDSASRLIQSSGEKACAQILDEAGIFYFYDTYVFVMSFDGKLLADPSFPTDIGRNVIDFKDCTGHMIVREMLDKLKKEDKVYQTYMWPAPGQANPSKKILYSRKVVSGQDTLVVGSSLFLTESIWKKF